MKYNKMTRRHFLQGTGSSFLTLPFMTSLMSTAEAATLPSQKCMVIFWTGHGAINLQNMYPINSNPAVSGQMISTPMYPSMGHEARSGRLVNMKTTKASNMPYLATSLGYGIPDESNRPVMPEAYGARRGGADLDNGAARVSPILGSFISDAHLNKMNLIAGLDMMYQAGHTNAQTGNFCNYNGNSPAGNENTNNTMKNFWMPTIDSVIANNPSFYGPSSPIAKSVVLGSLYGATDDMGGFISCERLSGGISPNSNNPRTVGDAFNLLFGSLRSGNNPTAINKKNFVLNNVHADYVRLSRGAYGPGRRIGKEDRNRLEEFMTNLSSILRGVISDSGATCTIPNISPNDQSNIVSGTFSGEPISLPQNQQTLSLYNQIIAASFACGVTKQFVVGLPAFRDQFIPEGSVGATFTDGMNNTDAHQAVFHNHNHPERQQLMVESTRHYFQHGFYDLMQKLDSMQAAEGSLLDQSYMFWTSECGFNTHHSGSLQMITAGSAGGFFKTGQFVDYRHPNRLLREFTYGGPVTHQGLPYNRYLATVLQSMGVEPAAYEVAPSNFAGTSGIIPVTARETVPGYGHPFQNKYRINNDPGIFVYEYALNDMSVPLPIIT